MPTRAYLRVDPGLRRTKREYPDGAFRAFVETLCAADGQERRGRFESAEILKAVLGPRRRWIAFLLDHGDLVERADGELYVDGWDEWQEGDLTVTERMARYRARKDRNGTADPKPKVTPSVTPEVTPSVTRNRQTETVRRRPSSGGISISGDRDKRVRTNGPGNRAEPKPAAGRLAGASSLGLEAGDPRIPVARLLSGRFRFGKVSAEQWERLDELVDQEYPRGTKKGADPAAGWQWLAELMASLDRKAGDPIEAAFAEGARRRGERLRTAAEAEETWSAEKDAAPTHPGLATASKQLAGRVTPKRNGKLAPAQREAAVAQLRSIRGQLGEPMWSELLRRYHLTEADLDAAG